MKFKHYFCIVLAIIIMSSIAHSSELDRHLFVDIVRVELDQGFECRVVEWDRDHQVAKIVYTTSQHISDISWSRNHTYLAFQVYGVYLSEMAPEEKLKIKKLNLDPAEDYGHKLVILNKDYQRVTEIPNVRRYGWNPNNQYQIAAIAGDHTESGIEYNPKEVLIYDIEKQEKINIPHIAIDVFWAKHDNKVYLFNFHSKVYAFDPVQKIVSETPYLGNYFSSDGSYYYAPTLDDSYFTIRKTSNNEVVQTHLILKEEYLQPEGWLESTNCLVVYNYNKDITDIINIETGKSVQIPKQFKHKMGAYVPHELLDDSNKPFLITEELIRSLK